MEAAPMILTRKMLEALAILHTDPNHQGLIHSTTAYALNDRGFVCFNRSNRPQIEVGVNDPRRHLVYLTDAGLAFCAQRFRGETIGSKMWIRR